MKNRTIKLVVLVVIIILLFFGLSIFERVVKNYQDYSVQHNVSSYPYNILILQYIIYCFAGMIFGIEKVFAQKKKSGTWKFDLRKLLIWGIASFIVGNSIILMWKFTFLPNLLGLSYINFSLFTNFMQNKRPIYRQQMPVSTMPGFRPTPGL